MILAIEDDEPMVLLLRALLSPGQRVDWARSLADGLKALSTRALVLNDPYVVVLVDLRLPDSDMASTIARVDEMKAMSPETKIILMTAARLQDIHYNRPDVQLLDKAHGDFAQELERIVR